MPNVLVVNPSLPANNVKELIAHLKANPGKLAFASAGVPPELVRRLNTEINRILQTPEMKERLANLGADGAAMTSEQFTNFIRAEIAKFAEVVKKSGAKVD